MDPALHELIAAGAPGDETAIIVRLGKCDRLPPGLRLVARFGDVATGRVARRDLQRIHDDPCIHSLKAPRVYAGEFEGELDAIERGEEPGISESEPDPKDTDRRRPEGLAETGKGAIVAVIDWGCDFAHPDFRAPDGRTRLLALWDQRAPATPNPYGYGRIHRRSDIDKALAADDPFQELGYRPSAGAEPTHGTHVLGIAAGNGAAGGPAGVAPEADICFVHLGPGLGDLGNSIDLLEAIHFVTTVAGARPLAINMSIGRHAGPHDGTLLIERAIDWLIVNRPGTAVVQSTGNYHARNTHMSGRLREMRTERLPFRLTRRDATPVVVELWYKAPDNMAVRAIAPDGASASADRDQKAELRGRDGTEFGRLYHRGFDPNNGDHFVMLTLGAAAPAGDWALEITGIDVVDGRWHAWIERNASCPTCQGQFLPDYANPETSTGSICNAMRTIAVGAYDGHDPDHPVAKFSSVGPTRDGRPKPLLSAPGVKILSVRSRASASDPPGYVRMSGTSMAAPHVTGAMALMMQAAGVQPIAAMRRALFGALEPAPGPGRRWGYGLLDLAPCAANARALKLGRPLRTRALTPRSASPAEADELILQEAFAMTEQLESLESSWTMTEAEVEALFAPSIGVGAEPAPMPEPIVDPALLLQADPAALLHQAADPGAPKLSVLGYPGRRLEVPLAKGDLLVDRKARRRARVAMIDDPALQAPQPGELPGRFVRLRQGRRRLTGPDGLILPEYYVLRPADEGAAEAVSKPTLRQGSAGAAVTEAQIRLNQVHTLLIARAEGGLDRCPLTTDGKFGQNTRAAVVSFQRIAFPGQASEWDGVVGPRTWDALIDASGGEGEEPKLPATCPGLSKKEVIDNFDFGSSKVLPRHQPKIVAIARCVVESQKTKTPITTLKAIGHTDPVGSDKDNDELGLDRAKAVKKEILDAIKRITGKTATLVIDVDTRGEHDRIPGDDAANRRVEIFNDFDFVPVKPPVVPAAEIEFVLDDKKKRSVDAKSPVATALMFGLWDQAYDASSNVNNGAAEADNFVGSDLRRFYIRVRDSKATGSTVTAQWKTLTAGGADDDAPASQDIRLTETSAGSKVFVSKALMLVTDDADAKQDTHSGFTSGAGSGVRKRGESNHRLRRAALDGQIEARYTPASGGGEVKITRPVFERKPESRRKLAVNVVNYDSHATAAQITNHFAAANRRWAQTGLRIDPGKTEDRTLPAKAKDPTDAEGRYATRRGDDDEEVAALDDLINGAKIDDNTLTVVFVKLIRGNAYTTLFERKKTALGDRYFIFINPGLDPVGDTLGHEMHHVLNNRPDTDDDETNIAFRRFFSFNTNPSAAYGLALPDVRVRRRIHTKRNATDATDPNNDSSNDNVFNWMRRARTTRIPFPNPLDAPDSSTGNKLTRTL
jgi:subtilisin family serine protease/outer membrane protein OmpA-like peptidoglycan-associated protein